MVGWVTLAVVVCLTVYAGLLFLAPSPPLHSMHEDFSSDFVMESVPD